MSDERLWTWANWIKAKERVEEECRERVYRAECAAMAAVQEATEEARRARVDLHDYGLYDRHREMLEKVAGEAAGIAASELAERIANAVEDALKAFRERLEKS